MVKVGLTGGISTGKTTVGTMFVEMGCHLIDSDRITHELFEPGEAVHESVVARFGAGIRDVDGRIDRLRLGEIVFNNPARRETLNGLVHPAVIERQKEFLASVESRDPDAIAIVDAALMIEVGTYKSYDKVVVVTCSPDQQRSRLIEREGLSAEEIEKRIQSQMPLEEKAKYADFVIDNSGPLESTRRQVVSTYEKLRELA
jgi:dephospho-CoA kinase